MNPRSSKRFSFRRRHSHRRGNPEIAGFSTTELIKLALGAGTGVLASKYLTQMVLGGNNTGIQGYGVQGIAVLALGWAANKFVGKDAATGVVAGGLGALAMRIYTENISGSTTSMSGFGDLDVARLAGTTRGMGEYRPGNIAMPSSFAAPPPVVVPAKTRSRG